MLLSQPDILRKMNEFAKTKNSNFHTSEEEINKKIKNSHMKDKLKLKVSYINQISNFDQNSNKEVQKLIEKIDVVGCPIKANEKVSDEISKQTDTFKARLEEKRKKRENEISSNGSNNDRKINKSGRTLISMRSIDSVQDKKLSLTVKSDSDGLDENSFDKFEEDRAGELKELYMNNNLIEIIEEESGSMPKKIQTVDLNSIDQLIDEKIQDTVN